MTGSTTIIDGDDGAGGGKDVCGGDAGQRRFDEVIHKLVNERKTTELTNYVNNLGINL